MSSAPIDSCCIASLLICINLKSSEIISQDSFLSSVFETHTESTSQDVYSEFLYMSSVSYNYS